MNANLWTQLLIAIVPALITGVGSLIIAIKKCKNEINTLETNNKKDYIEFVLEKSKGYGNSHRRIYTGVQIQCWLDIDFIPIFKKTKKED